MINPYSSDRLLRQPCWLIAFVSSVNPAIACFLGLRLDKKLQEERRILNLRTKRVRLFIFQIDIGLLW